MEVIWGKQLQQQQLDLLLGILGQTPLMAIGSKNASRTKHREMGEKNLVLSALNMDTEPISRRSGSIRVRGCLI